MQARAFPPLSHHVPTHFQVSQEFLEFSKSRGNDLMTKQYSFPGLKAGDRWCLCAMRWKEALEAGKAPPVVMAATSPAALNYVTLGNLEAHAVGGAGKAQ